MKIDRHGQAKILSQTEIQLLFSEGFQTQRDRALFAVALFSACRINEACTLLTQDIYDTKRRVRPYLLIRKANTKGQLDTRTIPIIEDLRSILATYQPVAGDVYLFPGRFNVGHINPDSAARILRKASQRVGIEGASTHSFRRTALTQMSNAGIPLRVIAAYSGHRDLSQLAAYLEVRDEQILGAAATLSMLSPIVGQVGKVQYSDIPISLGKEQIDYP
ncbi:MAG: site-specific integrase [Cyanobacteriota bacterium]